MGTAPPDAFGPFRVLHQIGAGALGPVFRAYDPDRDRLVAVKLFRLDLAPERVHQLVADFQLLMAAMPAHRSIVAPIATAIDGVTAYLAQDYVAAESLDITIREHGAASPADALRVAEQLAGALDAAAAAGIDHGVLHPRDVLLSADETRLTGLGIARALDRIGVPTPVRRPYTAPERVVGSPWDRRADVFGLAAMIHEMLWARRVAAVGAEAAASLTEIDGGDLVRLRALFGRALAEDPGARFGTALEFAGALKEAFPDTAYETEPRLPLEPPTEDPEPVELLVHPGIPPVLPPDLIDSYRPAPDNGLSHERSRSSISPLAFALVVGAALGFAAGFGVGVRSRSEPFDEASTVGSQATPGTETAAATTGAAREFTEGTVAGALKPAEDAELTSKPTTGAAIVGSLLVRSTPLGAKVFVDGREYGRTPVTVGNLVRGTHSVRVARDGYAIDERQVTITSAQRAHSVTVRLTPERTAPVVPVIPVASAAAPAATTGPLTVESRPAGAKVFIDGQLVGTTPLTLASVPAGDHAIHLDRDGYRRWSSAIRILTTERNRVTASLDR